MQEASLEASSWIEVQKPDLEEPDSLEGYTSEECDLARALGGVGMVKALLGSDNEVEVTVGMSLTLQQINLHHNKEASAALLLHLAESEGDVALIQEP